MKVLSNILVAEAQEVEQVVHQSEDHQFNSRLLQSTCLCVLGQHASPQIAPDGCLPSVCEWLASSDGWGGTLRGRPRHQCVNEGNVICSVESFERSVE